MGKTMDKAVYDFKIRYEHDDFIQHRFVVAVSADEAFEKLEQHRKKCLKEGIADFIIIGYPTVEIDYVID